LDDLYYIHKVLQGDKNAFVYLIRAHQDMAFHIAMPMIKDKEEAKDVVQEAFLIAFSKLHTFKQEAKFSSWFYRIVVNQCLQHIDKFNRRQAILENTPIPENLQNSYNEALRNLNKENLQKIVRSILNYLSPKESLILQLFYLSDYSIKEIESITSFSQSNIKVLLHRGRANFYAFLVENYNLEEIKDLL